MWTVRTETLIAHMAWTAFVFVTPLHSENTSDTLTMLLRKKQDKACIYALRRLLACVPSLTARSDASSTGALDCFGRGGKTNLSYIFKARELTMMGICMLLLSAPPPKRVMDMLMIFASLSFSRPTQKNGLSHVWNAPDSRFGVALFPVRAKRYSFDVTGGRNQTSRRTAVGETEFTTIERSGTNGANDISHGNKSPHTLVAVNDKQ